MNNGVTSVEGGDDRSAVGDIARHDLDLHAVGFQHGADPLGASSQERHLMPVPDQCRHRV
jgi:hypothetical protein